MTLYCLGIPCDGRSLTEADFDAGVYWVDDENDGVEIERQQPREPDDTK